MTEYTATPASADRYFLAEGPIWDAARQRALWVDIDAGTVFEGVFDDGMLRVTDSHVFGEPTGAVVVAEDGSLLVAGREHVISVSPTGERTRGPRVVTEGSGGRTNDGKTDPAGRFLIGSAHGTQENTERLVRVEADGSVTVLDEGLGLSNGLAWTADGATLYSIDTPAGLVWARDYDAATGSVGARRQHLHVDGFPDGMSIDTEGNLWIAVWGAGQVRRYSPSGEILDTVHIDAPHSSSVAFVGAELDTLLITTAQEELTPEQLAAHPLSGSLFTVWVDAVGVPSTPWRPFS
jgi:sugar lactone lactonase YvrE